MEAEMLEKLVAVWPEDSQYILGINSWFSFHVVIELLDGTRVSEIWPDATHQDLENAVARNLIENELLRIGCRRIHTEICATDPKHWIQVHMPQPWFKCGEKSTAVAVGSTRTEALVKVATEAFEARRKG